MLGTSQLLQVLGRLSDLCDLDLQNIFGEWPKQQLSAYSALTASSNLQQLVVSGCNVPGAPWAHVFPAGRRLPQLHSISAARYDGRGPSPMRSTAIDRLVSCCPALKQLHIDIGADLSLTPLQSLTALTSLRLEVGPVSPAVISSDLAALTQLEDLRFKLAGPAAGPDKIGGSGLQYLVPLTALTALTSLCTWDLTQSVWPLKSRAPAGSPPDVWAQLLKRCAADQASQQPAG